MDLINNSVVELTHTWASPAAHAPPRLLKSSIYSTNRNHTISIDHIHALALIKYKKNQVKILVQLGFNRYSSRFPVYPHSALTLTIFALLVTQPAKNTAILCLTS